MGHPMESGTSHLISMYLFRQTIRSTSESITINLITALLLPFGNVEILTLMSLSLFRSSCLPLDQRYTTLLAGRM